MFFQKYKEIALSELDSARKEHDALAKQIDQIEQTIMAEKKCAVSLVEEVTSFFESIVLAPFSIKTKLRIVKEQQMQFITSREIRQKERREKYSAGLIAVAGIIAGVKNVPNFSKFIDKKFVRKLTSLFRKNLLSAILFFGILVLILLILLISWTISNYLAGKTAKNAMLKIIQRIAELQKSHTTITSQKKMIITQQKIVRSKLDELSFLRGMNGSKLSNEQITALLELLEETRGLAASLNK